MAQENQGTTTPTPESLPVKRKRGRPRKDGSQVGSYVRAEKASATPTPDTAQRSQRRRTDPVPLAITGDPLVGQQVHGVLDGSFEAGYLLTVRVGDTGTILRGLVFKQGLSVPISGANDLAPNINMLRRVEVAIPQGSTPIQVHGSTSQSAQKNERPVEHPQQNLNQVLQSVSQTPKVAPQASLSPLQFSQVAATTGVQNNTQQRPQASPSQHLISQVASTGVQNNTQQLPQAMIHTSQHARAKTKDAVHALTEGHSVAVTQVSPASSQAKDVGHEKTQLNNQHPFFTSLQPVHLSMPGARDDRALNLEQKTPSTEISLNHVPRGEYHAVVGPKIQHDLGFASMFQSPKTGPTTELLTTSQDGATHAPHNPQSFSSTAPSPANNASKPNDADSVGGGLQIGLN